MITAILFENSDRDILGFEIKGHALFDKTGKDIVCSAVSVLAINTINSISEISPLEDENFEVEYDENGYILFMLKDLEKIDEIKLNTSLIILKSLKVGLISVKKEFNEFLDLYFKEV